MAKILRALQKIYGSSAGPTEVGVIGSFAAGSPVYSNDPVTIQSLSNYLDGLYAQVLGNNSPSMQDFNAIFYLFSRQLAYLMQAGVAEYDATTTYYIGSYANEAGVIYKSLTDNNTGNTPSTSPAQWARYTIAGATTDNAIVRFDGVNGSQQNSVVTIGDAGEIAGVTSSDSGSANSFALARTRSVSTSVSPGGVAVSSNAASTTESTTSDQTLGVTATIDTSGRPVKVFLEAGSTSGSYLSIQPTGGGGSVTTSVIKLKRNGTTIASFTLGTENDTNLYVPPGCVCFTDNVAAGNNYAYTCTIAMTGVGTGNIVASNIRIVAYEL